MDLQQLSLYEMNPQEEAKWNAFCEKTASLCDREVLENYASILNVALMNFCIEDHIAGYKEDVGYYYIVEDDYGKLSAGCVTTDIRKMGFYILKDVYYKVASQIELRNRTIYQKAWQYYHERNTKEEEIRWKYNSQCIYYAYYDPRKAVFEYVLRKLLETFSEIELKEITETYENYLNLWFEDSHWKWNGKTFTFEEKSDSIDRRFKKK